MKIFGERLKILRKTANLSQTDLGKILGISCATISQYESDSRFPNQEILILICKYFNISSDYLLGLSDIKTSYLKANGIIINCDDLSGEQRETIKLLLEVFISTNIKRDNEHEKK
ncbi:MAG: helix-turn-helix domain-containing protein [Spirochaetia bacterium]|nr:helix-turn-helix domain-containing protein [Spirochaetia bacterium]